MAQSNDFTQSELMSTESGEPSFSVAKVDSPILRISPADLDTLVGTLEVRHVILEECTLKGDRRFEPGNDGMTRLYYGMWGDWVPHNFKWPVDRDFPTYPCSRPAYQQRTFSISNGARKPGHAGGKRACSVWPFPRRIWGRC